MSSRKAAKSGLLVGVGRGNPRGEGADFALDIRLCKLLESWCLVMGADVASVTLHESGADRGRIIGVARALGGEANAMAASNCAASCRSGFDSAHRNGARAEGFGLEGDHDEVDALGMDLLTPLQLGQAAHHAGMSGELDDPDAPMLQGSSPSYHWIAIALSRQGNCLLTLAVACTERRRIQLVKSRLRLHRQAVTVVANMWQQNSQVGQLVSGLASTVETLADGVILADASERVVYANEAARRLTGLRPGDALLSYLTVGDLDHLSWLQLLGIVQRTIRQAGATPVQPLPILVNREGGRPLIAAVRSLERLESGSDEAGVVVFLIDPDSAADDEMMMICQLHDLTQTEARLAIQLAKGLTLAEAADAMRIKQQTARAYLKQIFDKFSVHRQADLIRLLLRSIVNCRLAGKGLGLPR